MPMSKTSKPPAIDDEVDDDDLPEKFSHRRRPLKPKPAPRPPAQPGRNTLQCTNLTPQALMFSNEVGAQYIAPAQPKH